MLTFFDRWGQNPWRQLRRLQQEMNQVFGSYLSPRAGGFPALNVWTKEHGAVVTCELPGVDPASLEVTASGQTLSLRGERKVVQADENVRWHRRERRVGSFARSLQLPFNIDPDSVQASCRDGVLTISLERVEAERPRKIAVQAG